MRILLAVSLLLAITSSGVAGEGKESEFVRQGTEYLRVRNYQRALKSFEEAVRVNPSCAEAQRGLGVAYLKLGSGETASNAEMLGDAAEALKEALRLAPNDAQSHFHLGMAYLAVHNKDAAVKEYKALKGLDAKLAGELQGAIGNYRAPRSFRPDKSGGGDFRTPVAIVGNQVMVPVTVSHGERSVETTLILDTGASVTVVSAEVARRLGIDLAGAPRMRGNVVGGGMVTGWHVKLGVAAGPYSRDGIDVAVIPTPVNGLAADGLLGMNFLRSYKYHIDFRNHVIDWSP